MMKERNSEAEVIDLVPIAMIAVEVGESVDTVAHRFREVVVLDDMACALSQSMWRGGSSPSVRSRRR